LDELGSLWAEYAERVAARTAPNARSLYLVPAAGHAEMLFIGWDHTVVRAVQTAEVRKYSTEAPLEQQVILLRAALSPAEGQAFGYLSPETLHAIRARLLKAGLDAPEVDLWEVYHAPTPQKG
jgi:hypothetical protein